MSRPIPPDAVPAPAALPVVTPPAALSMGDVLRCIEAIVEDRSLSHGEARALARLVLHVNRAGNRAFPSVRTLARETGVHPRDICTALSKGEGRHVARLARPRNAPAVYAVLSQAPTCCPGGSAGASPTEAPALPSCFPGGNSGASNSPLRRFQGGSVTVGNRGTEGGEPTAFPPGVRTSDGNNGDGTRLLRLWQRHRQRPASASEAEAFLRAVDEALAAGATVPLVAAEILGDGAGPPWSAPQAAREKAFAVLGAFRRLVGTADLALGDIDRLAFDLTVPDGFSRQGDLDDLRHRHADVLAAAAAWPAAAAEPEAVVAGGGGARP